MKIAKSVWLVASLVGCSGARADVASYSATFDEVSEHLFQSEFVFDSFNFFSSSTGLPTFTANFANDKQLRLTYSAPAGQRFFFTPPQNAIATSLGIDLGSSDGGLVTDQAPGVSVDFADLKGSLGAVGDFTFYVVGADFGPTYDVGFTGPISFQSISVLFDVPVGYNQSFTSIQPIGFIHGLAALSLSDPDPGIWAGLEPDTLPTPEPANGALLLIAAGGAALLARHTWRRSRHRQRGGLATIRS